MDRLTAMAVFVKVVEAESFVAAARHFALSPAMVSKHVRMMEDRLGVRLLNRTTRRVHATEVGQDYYENCLRILAEVDDAERSASHLQSTARGLLKVSAPVTYGGTRIAPAVGRYLEEYPQVSVELSLNDRYVDLLADGIDVAVRIGTLPDSSLIARRLAEARVVLCAAPAYLDRSGMPQAPEDLSAHNCLLYTYPAHRGLWQFQGPDAKPVSVRVSGRFAANNGESLRQLAVMGHGIILEPDYVVEADIEARRLVPLLSSWHVAATPIHAVYSSGHHLSAKIRTFVDFLATALAVARPAGAVRDAAA